MKNEVGLNICSLYTSAGLCARGWHQCGDGQTIGMQPPTVYIYPVGGLQV
jgi:hypothetical protein